MSDPVYRLDQVYRAVASNSRCAKGREYELIGRVHELRIGKNIGVCKVLNNMGQFYAVQVRRGTKGQERWQDTGFVGRCTCPDPHALCKHVAAGVFAVGRRLEADPKAYAAWMQMSAPDDLTPVVMSRDEARDYWDRGQPEQIPALDPDSLGRPDELLRRLGPAPRGLELPDLPDLLAPAIKQLAKAGYSMLSKPDCTIGGPAGYRE
jgi:hypothetical protein